MLAEVDGVRDELDELRGLVRGRIAIGALLPAGGIEVTTLLARFTQAFPGIEVGLREGTAADMLELIEADELDVAFSLDLPASLPDGVEGLEVSEEEVVAAYPAGDGAGRERVGSGRPRRPPAGDAALRARRSSAPPTRSSTAPASGCGSRSRAATPT